MKQLALDFVSTPPPTLDNFVPGCNGEVVENITRLVAGSRERSIYVWGSAGCGRSHLLEGAVASMRRAGHGAIYHACGRGSAVPDLERCDLVALDDVDRLDPEGQLSVFHLFNTLRECGGGLLASGAAPPVQLQLREDLATRLGWGLVFQVHPLSDEDKARALFERAAALGFGLPPAVCDLLLTRGRRDMRSLLALVDALDRYSLETKRPVTAPLARELLGAAEARAAGPVSGDGGSAA